MDGNQREHSSSEEDDTQEIRTEVSCLETDYSTETTSYRRRQLSPEDLTRRPLRREKEHTPVESKEHLLNPKPNKKTKAKGTSNDSPTSPTFYVVIFVVLAILCFVCLCLFMSKPSPSSPPTKRLDVPMLMRDLKSRFEGQPSLTYRVIEAAIKTAFSESLDSPGIIVLISSKESEDTTNQLANRLVQLVSDPLSSVLIDSRYSLSKKEIDSTIQGNLTEAQTRAVLVRNLDKIPFEVAMIFHSYCDHENAPFKRAIYVMTTSIMEDIPPDSDSKHWDTLASRRLKAAWSDSGEDQVASLISRLTVSVAAVVPKVA